MPATLQLIDDPYRLCPRADRRAHRAVVHHVRRYRKPTPTPLEDDLLAWSQYYLPHYFQQPPSAMHREVAALLDAMSNPNMTASPLPIAGEGPGVRGEVSPDVPSQITPSRPHVFTPSPFRLNLLAPRASAKSTLVTLGHVLREAVRGREPYIWIISDTKRQAHAHLDNLYAELEDNRLLRSDYRRARNAAKSAGRITLGDVCIEAYGTGQRIRGHRWHEHRPTLIICDDLQNDGHIRSASQRARSRNWFHGMLMNAGTYRTKVINLGTALHREALAVELHTAPGWTSRRFQAIREWPTNMHLWAEWEEIYRTPPSLNVSPLPAAGRGAGGEGAAPTHTPSPSPRPSPVKGEGDVLDGVAELQQDSPSCATAGSPSSAEPQPQGVPPELTSSRPHVLTTSPQQLARNFYNERREQMEAGSALLWPEQEDLYTLMSLRAASGPAVFEREKQCVPMNPEECEWPQAYFTGDIWFSEWPQDLQIKTIALDPSKGTDAKHGDYSAFVLLGLAHDGTFYVEANLARRPTTQIVTDGVALINHFRPNAFGVEANQFQSLLAAEFHAEFHRQRLVTAEPEQLVNHLAKQVRIRTLGPLLAGRRFKFKSNSPGTKMLVDQLQEFPASTHDDGPDALEMAIRLAGQLLQPVPNDGLGNCLITE
jgi:predicted phage terminase large subunit-like protein